MKEKYLGFYNFLKEKYGLILFCELLSFYSEAHRYYHTMDHK